MEKAKIGVAFNCFSATELLPYAIEQIKDFVDVIVCITQERSYQNNNLSGINKNILWGLKNKGVIDHLEFFYPNPHNTAKQNEVSKRNLGKNFLKSYGCTHFLTMDEDEFYQPLAFKEAIDFVITHNFDSSACQMQTYYKSPEYKVTPPETYWVPFLYKLDKRRFTLNSTNYPVLADPSRRLVPVSKHFNFSRGDLQMHHMSYVRKDIRTKLFNSASAKNYGSRLEEIAKHWEQWKPGNKAYLGGSQKRLLEVEKCENIFGIPEDF